MFNGDRSVDKMFFLLKPTIYKTHATEFGKKKMMQKQQEQS